MLLNMRFPFQERQFSFCKSIHFFSSLWTGLWSSGELAPPSLPFPCYFFPQTESLFTGYFFSGFRAISITQPKGQIPLKLNFASPGKVSVRALFWVPGCQIAYDFACAISGIAALGFGRQPIFVGRRPTKRTCWHVIFYWYYFSLLFSWAELKATDL